MKAVFNLGDKKSFIHKVTEADTATFETGQVHAVYATFAIARDAEWCSRLFVLEMKEESEEGIGTFVEIQHQAPAFVGEDVLFEATIDELNGNAVNCKISAKIGERIVAVGRTGQKILLKEKIEELFNKIHKAGSL